MSSDTCTAQTNIEEINIMDNDSAYDPLAAIRKYLAENFGLNYSRRFDKDLIGKLKIAATSFGFKNYLQFTEWLLTTTLSDVQTGILASHLTIGETYFMRDKKGYDFLEQIYLPGIINKRSGDNRRLRIWCAGCATGEEAYSLAIVLRQSIPNIKDWNIQLLATDINPVFLEKARKGIYTKWSFRVNSPEFINKYFIPAGHGQFQILPEIKDMVSFAPLNLVRESFPSMQNHTNDIDIIFCRNVFIYFSPHTTKKITRRFYNSLVKGGVLIVSPVEMNNMISSRYSKTRFSGYTIYHKGIPRGNRVHEDSEGQFPESPEYFPTVAKEIKIERLPSTANELTRLTKLLPENEPNSRAPSPAKKSDFEQAVEYFHQDNFKKCELILENLLAKIGEENKSEMLLLAKTKANLGLLSEAEKICSKLLTSDKLDPSLYYLQATIKQEQGEDTKAISLLKQSLYLDGDFILANFLMGTLSSKSGDKGSEQKYFRNALTGLAKLPSDNTVPESGGLTAGRFMEIINSISA